MNILDKNFRHSVEEALSIYNDYRDIYKKLAKLSKKNRYIVDKYLADIVNAGDLQVEYKYRDIEDKSDEQVCYIYILAQALYRLIHRSKNNFEMIYGTILVSTFDTKAHKNVGEEKFNADGSLAFNDIELLRIKQKIIDGIKCWDVKIEA